MKDYLKEIQKTLDIHEKRIKLLEKTVKKLHSEMELSSQSTSNKGKSKNNF